MPTVIQKRLANTLAKNTLSESAQKQTPTANVPIATETMTQIQLNVPNTENNNKLYENRRLAPPGKQNHVL